jgi:glycine C-acetyltransferase
MVNICFVAADKDIIDYLKYTLTFSNVCQKHCQMIQTIGSLKRLELLRNHPD